MDNYKAYSPIERIELLMQATLFRRIQWCSLPTYLINNGRNKSLVNFVDMFAKAPPPIMLDDMPNIDIMKSYYCEYKNVAFCIMRFSQVLDAGKPPSDFYHFMIQLTPYDNFGYYSTSEETFQSPLQRLVELIELQISVSFADEISFYKVLSDLQKEIDTFDPSRESILMPRPPSPPHKHSCVVDKDNNYVTFVLILIERDANGDEQNHIQYYELKEGEQLLDVQPPSKLIKAQWNGKTWIETASENEIAEYRRYHRY